MQKRELSDIQGIRLFGLAWVGVYPVVTLISWLFGAALMSVPLMIRTLILSGIVVSFMVFVWMPLLHRVHRLTG